MNRTKILLVMLGLVILGAGVYFTSNGGYFQGFIGVDISNEEVTNLENQIADKEAKIATLESETKTLLTDVQKKEKAALDARAAADKKQKEYDNAKASSGKISRNKKTSTTSTDLTKLEKELKKLISTAESKEKAAKDARTLYESKKSQLESARTELQTLQTQLNALLTQQTQVPEEEIVEEVHENEEVNPAENFPEGLSSTVMSSERFSPLAGETTVVSFNLNTYNSDYQPNKYALRIYTEDNGLLIKEMENSTDAYEISYSAEWDGRDENGKVVPDGYYVVELEIMYAQTARNQKVWGMTAVSQSGNGGEGVLEPYSYGDYQEPASLVTLNFNNRNVDPNTNTKGTFSVNLAKSARYSVKLYNSSTFSDANVVKTFADNEMVAASTTKSFEWDGRDDSGNVLGDAQYTVRVVAENDHSTGSGTGTLVLATTTAVVTPEVGMLTVQEEPSEEVVPASIPVFSSVSTFSPEVGILPMNFYLQNTDTYSVYVTSSLGVDTYFKVLVDDESTTDGYKNLTWDGRRTDNVYVNPGTYIIRVDARNDEMAEGDWTSYTYEVTVTRDYQYYY